MSRIGDLIAKGTLTGKAANDFRACLESLTWRSMDIRPEGKPGEIIRVLICYQDGEATWVDLLPWDCGDKVWPPGMDAKSATCWRRVIVPNQRKGGG